MKLLVSLFHRTTIRLLSCAWLCCSSGETAFPGFLLKVLPDRLPNWLSHCLTALPADFANLPWQSHWPSASLTRWFAACCGHLCPPLKVITVNCWYSEWVCVLEWASCQWVSSSYRSSFLTQICSPQACMQMSALTHACTLECEQWKKGVLYRNSLQLDWMQSLYCTYI